MPDKPKTPSGQKPSSSDERNLLEADSPSSLAPEEQVMYFLEKYKWILLAILVGGSAAFFYQYFGGWWADRKTAIMAEAFFEADTLEERFQFAEQFARSPLAGVALLEAARDQFEAGDYATASTTFRRAAQQLGLHPLAFRAQILAALSLALDDRGVEALSFLRGVLAQPGIPSSIEAEGLFHAAVLAHEIDDRDGYESFARRLEVHPLGRIWNNRLRPLRTSGLGEIIALETFEDLGSFNDMDLGGGFEGANDPVIPPTIALPLATPEMEQPEPAEPEGSDNGL